MKKSSKGIKKISYVDSLLYQMRLTARYMKILGEQIFSKMNINISFDEFISIAVISEYGSMCQRDLAKLILKDRANVGRIAKNLENIGLIEIINSTKNNRLVKNITLTAKGHSFLKDAFEKITPYVAKVQSNFSDNEIEALSNLLKNFRSVISTVIELKI